MCCEKKSNICKPYQGIKLVIIACILEGLMGTFLFFFLKEANWESLTALTESY